MYKDFHCNINVTARKNREREEKKKSKQSKYPSMGEWPRKL